MLNIIEAWLLGIAHAAATLAMSPRHEIISYYVGFDESLSTNHKVLADAIMNPSALQ